MFDAFAVITKEEGAKALFKGGVARVIRSSPQFAVTLAVYEWLKKTFPFPYGDKPLAGPSFSSPLAGGLFGRPDYDITRLRARAGLRILLDCHEDFGRTRVQPVGGKGVFAAKPRPAPLA
jgi:solute carrier family 25 aspartate/glutamate transporter 12/13